ncbi:DNA mismatch repair protein MutS, partial [candidate division WOR-3 bacterium]|nr:DNA mismatch repair protein MutS [candidate division WOR-3 bacterium]
LDVEDITISKIDDFEFDYEYTLKNLLSHFGVETLDGFGCGGMKEGIQASGAALLYAKRKKRNDLSYVERIYPYSRSNTLILDEATRRNLELIRKPTGETEGTLLSILEETVTPMGGRLLRDFLLSPLLDPKKIRERQDRVTVFYQDAVFTGQLRGIASQIPDLERLITRVSLERVDARDLIFLGKALKQFPKINKILPDSLSSFNLEDFDMVIEDIEKTIVESPPQTIKYGNIIKGGVNTELDELRALSKNAKLWIVEFENRERKRTDIQSLKVRFNSVFGYYIEVTRTNLPKVPEDYIRKQTLTNAERFITPELKEYEAKVLQADERGRLLEYEIFKELRDRLKNYIPAMRAASFKIAYLDVFSTLASIAKRYGYTRP